MRTPETRPPRRPRPQPSQEESAMKKLTDEQNRFGFHVHAFSAVMTMLLLVAINLYKGEPYWVLWVLLGWSMALLSHWWFVMGPGARRSSM
jgi:hypothetical protein